MTGDRVFQIERFYFGTLIRDGQAIGQPGVIANSAGVTPARVQEALRLARVRPPTPAETNDDMPGSLGFFRGDNASYLVVKSGRTAENIPQLLYLLVPDMALRWLGGNYTEFISLGYQEMPAFETPRRDLAPLTLEDPLPLTENEQIDLLYDLFGFCGGQIKTVEGLLAALIHNQPIAILNADLSLATRMNFIHGLLSLLPAPARVGMTWVSYTDKGRTTPAQISFVSQAENLDGSLIYDWSAGKLLNAAPADKYSKFIASQLRLDASLVIEATNSIARTAVWRAMRKDSLPQALHFASRRAAVDAAVANNQPADRETVAAILRQDPTLSPEMRVRYAQHLLAFTLALGDEYQHADVIPVVAAADRPVAELIYQNLKAEAEGNNPGQIIELVERWLTKVPQASVIPWNQLAYVAALNILESTVQRGDTDGVIGFLSELRQVDRALHIEQVVPRLLSVIQSAAAYDNALAMAVFLLATEYLPLEGFQQVISDTGLLARLPERLRATLRYLQPEPPPQLPQGLLMAVINEFEAGDRMLVMGRLAELAVSLDREELIDGRVLEGLLKVAQSGYAWRFAGLIQHLAEKYSQPAMLRELDPSTLELLPHLYFSSRRYEVGVKLLEHYQNTVFGQENFAAFLDMIGSVFLNSNLPVEALEQIFALIEHSKIRLEPRTRAYCAVLMAGEWSAAYKNLARRLTIMFYNDAGLLAAIGIDNALLLLEYHISLRDSISIQEMSTVLVEVALRSGKRGLELANRVWDILGKTSELSALRLDLLRQYVRIVDAEIAPQLPLYLGKRLGPNIGGAVQAAYVMRLVLNRRSMEEFTEHLGIASAFLVDIATTYHENKELPPKHRLRRDLNSMAGGLTDADRDLIGASIDRIAQAVYALGMGQDRGKAGDELEMALLRNQAVPQTGLDLLIFLGGYFSRRRPSQPDLTREAMTHVFGERSALMLRDEARITARLLTDLMTAFPPNRPPHLTLETLMSEIESLWKEIPLFQQRSAQPTLAADTQYLAYAIPVMARRGRGSAFKNRLLLNGEQQPANDIEALLWISGYFKRLHSPS